MLFRLTIPIPNYYRSEVFPQHLYIESERSPSYDEIFHVLEQLHKRDKTYPEYICCWKDCLASIVQAANHWPTLGGSLIETNTFVNVEVKYKEWPHKKQQVRSSLSVRLIRPIQLNFNRSIKEYI